MNPDWIIIKEIENLTQKEIFKTQLHDGEVEVMILGQELNADLLIIDDYNAREYAKYLDFNVIGTLGILSLAKTKRIIKKTKPFLDMLRANNIYISNRLYKEILILAEE